MTQVLGELVSAPEYALAFRSLQPMPATPERLLVLVHGWGSDERQLAPFAQDLDAGALVALPRGPRSADADSQGWYRVALGGDVPRMELEEAADSLGRLADFVGQLQARHGLPAARTVVAGFSQGGELAAALALNAPDTVAGFAVFGGRVPDELLVQRPVPGDARRLQALLVHGRHDEVLPFACLQQGAARLRRLGIAPVLSAHDAGHEVTAGMWRAFRAWFADRAQRWNATEG